jgi:hypothetical protein
MSLRKHGGIWFFACGRLQFTFCRKRFKLPMPLDLHSKPIRWHVLRHSIVAPY